jgi:hypothetical protein
MQSRLAKARDAYDEIVAACRRAMGDALLIEAQAQCRLADEYDAAQQRGEIATHSPGNPKIVPNKNDLKQPATSDEVGISRKQVLEARITRDAEKANPGVVRKAVEARLNAGKEPTRADVKRATSPPKPSDTPSSRSDDFNEDDEKECTDYIKAEYERAFSGLIDEDDEEERNYTKEEYNRALGRLLYLVSAKAESDEDWWIHAYELLSVLFEYTDFISEEVAKGRLKITSDPERVAVWKELDDRYSQMMPNTEELEEMLAKERAAKKQQRG